jgi:putative addiction module killer protein
MIEVRRRDEFVAWLAGLRDKVAAARISARIDRLATGNLGDVEPVGKGVSELRIHYGPGYRVYFPGRAGRSCCCCAAATRARRSRTLSRRSPWRRS